MHRIVRAPFFRLNGQETRRLKAFLYRALGSDIGADGRGGCSGHLNRQVPTPASPAARSCGRGRNVGTLMQWHRSSPSAAGPRKGRPLATDRDGCAKSFRGDFNAAGTGMARLRAAVVARTASVA
jgi:hypothetical protein